MLQLGCCPGPQPCSPPPRVGPSHAVGMLQPGGPQPWAISHARACARSTGACFPPPKRSSRREGAGAEQEGWAAGSCRTLDGDKVVQQLRLPALALVLLLRLHQAAAVVPAQHVRLQRSHQRVLPATQRPRLLVFAQLGPGGGARGGGGHSGAVRWETGLEASGGGDLSGLIELRPQLLYDLGSGSGGRISSSIRCAAPRA
jgi:hypothetical protein